MKIKALLFLAAFLCLSIVSFGQASRFDSQAWTTANILGNTGVVKAVPGAQVTLCTYPAATFGACSKVPLCPDNTQVGCTTATNPVTADTSGNFGWWVAPGKYDYWITAFAVNTGPYHIVAAPDVASINKTVYADQQAGADACAQITAAIALLPSGGGIVDATAYQGTQTECAAGDLNFSKANVSLKIGMGVLQINGNLHITANNIQIECLNPKGGLAFKSNQTAASHVLFIDSNTTTVVKGCWINQYNVTGRTGVQGNISVIGATDVQILNNHFGLFTPTAYTGADSTCLWTQNTKNILVEGNYCIGSEADGFHVSRGSSQVRIVHNYVEHIGDDGIALLGYTDTGAGNWPTENDVTVANNTLVDIGTGVAGRCITFMGVNGGAITSNTCDSVVGPGINLNGGDGSVVGVATHYNTHITATGNILRNTGTALSSPAFLLYKCRDCNIDNNTIEQHASGDALQIQSAGKDLRITNNNFSNAIGRCVFSTQLNTNDARTILELITNFGESQAAVGITDIQITGNTCRKFTINGIEIDGEAGLHSTNIEIKNNHIYGATTNQVGILNLFSDNFEISGNHIYGNTTGGIAAGIRISTSSHGLTANNHLYQTQGDGIDNLSVFNNLMVGNQADSVQTNAFFVDANGGTNFIMNNTCVAAGSNCFLIQDATSFAFYNVGGNASTIQQSLIDTVSLRSKVITADQGSICTNGELALSAGWQSTGSATATAVQGSGQTCSWTITTGTTTAANPTITDTLTNALPTAATVCWMSIYGGTHTAVAGESLRLTTISATAPIFTANFTPTAGGTTYFVTRGCGP